MNQTKYIVQCKEGLYITTYEFDDAHNLATYSSETSKLSNHYDWFNIHMFSKEAQ